jgi:hypothetical protein
MTIIRVVISLIIVIITTFILLTYSVALVPKRTMLYIIFIYYILVNLYILFPNQ